MAVVLSDRDLTVYTLTHPWGRDAHGVPVPPSPDARSEPRGTWPGAANEQTDGSWALRADPAAWPMEPGDAVGDGTHTWTVVSALLKHVPGFGAADYVAIVATLNPPEVP